jgi:anti-sigma regulatory factor (Ser/Thr protein kinase)
VDLSPSGIKALTRLAHVMSAARRHLGVDVTGDENGVTLGTGTTRTARWFPATPESVADARSWVSRLSVSTGHGPLAHTVELLVSELATNAVRYSEGEQFLVHFDADARVVVAVCDTNPGAPIRRQPDPTQSGGRGLQIVAALADRWGVELRGDGKCLWFQLDGDPEPRLA